MLIARGPFSLWLTTDVAWLTDLELGAFLTECRLLDCIPADPSWLQGLCNLARVSWETQTGWIPYLIADPATLTLRPRTRVVDLPSALVDCESVTLDGINLVQGQHYELIGRGDCVKLSLSGSELVITGAVLGREADLPADVREALLSFCASRFAERQAGSTGVVNDVRQGDVSFRSKQTQSEAFKGIWAEAVKRHRRVVIR